VKVKKTPEEIAEAINQAYGDDPIGPELYAILAKAIIASGYEDAEIEEVRKQVGPILKELRRIRRAS